MHLKNAHQFDTNKCKVDCWASIYYQLPNTLPAFSSASSVVCTVYDNHSIQSIIEQIKIYQLAGNIVYAKKGKKTSLTADTKVSLNCGWFFLYIQFF